MQVQDNRVSLLCACIMALAGCAFALVLAGCGGDKSGGCRVDDDCPVGDACVIGECRPLAGADLSGLVVDLGAGGDLATPIPDGWNPDALAASCTFNGDGTITRSEESFMVGLGALFAVNAPGTTVPVNNVAQNGVWDFSAPVSGEAKQFDQLVDPSGQWWAADFPTATYAERIDDGQQAYGIFRVGADKLEMLGVVSDQNTYNRTELTYATPIVVLQFPLSVGTMWTSESDVSGTASGVAFFAHESYVFSVGQRGTTKVPAASFDTLRIKMSYTQTYGALVTTRITYLHMAECYGAVARVRSQDNETAADFTQAAEYRRLANP
ncbi:MAG TPA: hypothetical protein VHB97_04590 [Polyangia bacterium]|jgi:hypothetical protein|nr:hypothetical protein [Polyangia bacterium]